MDRSSALCAQSSHSSGEKAAIVGLDELDLILPLGVHLVVLVPDHTDPVGKVSQRVHVPEHCQDRRDRQQDVAALLGVFDCDIEPFLSQGRKAACAYSLGRRDTGSCPSSQRWRGLFAIFLRELSTGDVGKPGGRRAVRSTRNPV
jgi:hypothetical protein